MAGLTERQRRFVEEYVKTPNATEAYRRAGYNVSSDDAAAAHGSRLVGNGKIAAAIAEAREKRAKREQLSADWVLRKLRTESQRRGDGASHSARVKALELLGRHIGMFPKEVKHSGEVGVTVQMTHEQRANRIRELLALAQSRTPGTSDN